MASQSVTIDGFSAPPLTPSTHTLNSANSTNATSVKASAGTAFAITISNNGAAAAFVKLYNKASAPTVGTDTPIAVLPVGASAAVTHELGALGMRFSTGIALAITNLIADSDATAVAAGQVKTALAYV